MTIELIYDRDCPNADEARNNLKRALKETGITQGWVEWERSGPASPSYASQFGSPTVLVDGSDVAGHAPNGVVSCCRLYTRRQVGFDTAPSVESIKAALVFRGPPVRVENGGTRWHAVFAVPGLVLSILPFGGCPACWPVYAGLLSTLGLSFLLSRAYLLPLTVLVLLLAVVMLIVKRPHGYRPFILGVAAAALVLVGKFAIASDPLTYAGAALLLVASAWNAWPRRVAARCPKCAPSSRRLIQFSAQERNHHEYEQTKD